MIIKGDSMCPDITDEQFREMIKTGRLALEYRLLGIIMRPWILGTGDISELEEIKDLIAKFDQLMDEKCWLVPPVNQTNWKGELN